MRVTVDGYTRFVLTAIAVLLTVVAVGLWYESPSAVEAASAQIPDQGRQMAVLIEHAEATNAQLAMLNKLLVSGAVKVQVIEPNQNKQAQQ